MPASAATASSVRLAMPWRTTTTSAASSRVFCNSLVSARIIEINDTVRTVGCQPSGRFLIELPFGRGKTSPVAAADVARVVATVLADPVPHLGRLYELTGPRSQDMHGVAREFSDALNREVTYADIPPEEWERELQRAGLPEHLTRHLVTMAELHRAGRYDRLAGRGERGSRPAGGS